MCNFLVVCLVLPQFVTVCLGLNCCIYFQGLNFYLIRIFFSRWRCVALRATRCTPHEELLRSLLMFFYHISKVLDFDNDPLSSALFCAFLFTFLLMAPLANIVTRSRQCVDPSRHLTRRDIATNQHGLIVTFKCTKTLQFGERKLHIPLVRLPGSPLCPVSAYHRMIRLVPASSVST